MMGDGGEVDDLGLAQSAHDVSRVAEVTAITHASRRPRARARSRPKHLIFERLRGCIRGAIYPSHFSRLG